MRCYCENMCINILLSVSTALWYIKTSLWDVNGEQRDVDGHVQYVLLVAWSLYHFQEVLFAQFSLYVHKGGLKPIVF